MSDDEGPTCITVCQGPPRCPLVGDEAVAAAKTCHWCKRIYVAEDGSERIVEPGEA